MTIKTQVVDDETRIITKVVDGKTRISCECCAEPSECCMYPAAGLIDELFTYEDLPDQLIYKGRTGGDVTFNKLDPPLEFGSSFAYYISTTSPPYGSGDEDVIIIDDNAAWLNWISAGLNSIGLCLIEGYEETSGTADVFLDTYEVNFLTDKTVTVTRESLCSWFGSQMISGFLYEASLAYNDTTYSWEASFSTVDVSSAMNTKDGDQNTPVGSYPGDYAITVTTP